MGNSIRLLRGRSEEENVAIFKRVVGKYEEIRSRSQLSSLTSGSTLEANGARLSELEVYRELEQELFRVLGLPPPFQSQTLPSETGGNLSSADASVAGGDQRTAGNEQIISTPRLELTAEHESSAARTSISGNAAPAVATKSPGTWSGAVPASTGLVSGEGGKQASILVVDDSPISCKLARRGLSRFNFKVEVTSDGRRGLEVLHARPKDFDLVLLDIVMPGLDGIEVLRCMKSHAQLSDVTVAMVSGLEDDMLEEVCLQQGAVAVLKKPIKADEVMRVMQRHCQIYAPVPLPHPPSPDAPPPSTTRMPPKATTSKLPPPAQSGGEKGSSVAVTGPALGGADRKQKHSPSSSGKVFPGQKVPSFELLDVHKKLFRLRDVVAQSTDRQLLLAFFPAAFVETASADEMKGLPSTTPTSSVSSGTGSVPDAVSATGGLLSALMVNMDDIKATNTTVVGIGKDLPYTLSALSAQKGLDFLLLSDPFLLVSEHFVGTFDLGLFFPSAFGFRSPSATVHRGAHTGIVLMNARRKCVYRWLSVDESRSPVLPAVLDLPELMMALQDVPQVPLVKPKDPLPNDPTSSEAISRESNAPVKIPSFVSDRGRIDSGELARVRTGSGATSNDPRHCSRGRTGDGTGKKKVVILIVDDSTISFKLATRKLRGLGHATMHAENGKLALETLRRRSNQIDLVLLDIVMPVMDGVEFLNIVKSDPDLQRTPIVMVSGVEREQLERACIEAGALAVLQKPLKAQEVQDLMIREGIAPS